MRFSNEDMGLRYDNGCLPCRIEGYEGLVVVELEDEETAMDGQRFESEIGDILENIRIGGPRSRSGVERKDAEGGDSVGEGKMYSLGLG